MPYEVAWTFSNVGGYGAVENNTNLATSKWASVTSSVDDLNALLSDGNRVGLLINMACIIDNDKPLFTVPTHWIGLLSISANKETRQVSASIYTWGGHRNVTVDYSTFKDGFLGYVAAK